MDPRASAMFGLGPDSQAVAPPAAAKVVRQKACSSELKLVPMQDANILPNEPL